MNHLFLSVCMVILFASQAVSQDESWMPKGPPHSGPFNFDVRNVSIAKVSEDGKSIQLSKPVIVTETGTATKNKTVITQEARTRKVKKNGELVSEEYIVNVPRTVQEEFAYTVELPQGSVKRELPLEIVRAWEVSGAPLESAELVKRLEKSTHVWAIEDKAGVDFKALDPFYTSLLRPEAIVLFYTVPQDGEKAPESASAVPAPVPAVPTPTPTKPKPAPKKSRPVPKTGTKQTVPRGAGSGARAAGPANPVAPPASQGDSNPDQDAGLLKPTNKLESWKFELRDGGKGEIKVDEDAIVLSCTNPDGTDWHVQAYQLDLDLKDDVEYVVNFEIKADVPRFINLTAVIGQEDWHGIGLREKIYVAQEWTKMEYTFRAEQTVPKKNRLGFIIGGEKGTIFVKSLTMTAKLPKAPAGMTENAEAKPTVPQGPGSGALPAAPAMAQEAPADAVHQEIAELEKQLDALPDSTFDWKLHNGLRHLYASIDEQKSMSHVEEILKHQRLDLYMRECLVGAEKDPSQAIPRLLAAAKNHSQLPNLVASCLAWAADLEHDPDVASGRYQAALAVQGIDPTLKELIEDRHTFNPRLRQPWPAKILAPEDLRQSPGPWSDPADETVWPNTVSRANGDPWLILNHDKIQRMKPRLLLINFSNEHDRKHLDNLTQMLIRALAESTRYHGYADKNAPAFINYEIFKFVDLRDADRTVGDSRLMPAKSKREPFGLTLKYRQLFTDEFAAHYGVPDPRNPQRFLRLDELLDGGYVHELWFFDSGNVKLHDHVHSFEVVEEKPKYNEQFEQVDQLWVQAGNGGDIEQPWVGRSCRIGDVNASRGVGCFLESLAHGMEGTATSGSIPYFTKYFNEYSDFNLNTRYHLPFDSLYAVDYRDKPIRYPNPRTALIHHSGKQYKVDNYIPVGGSAHFPPNGRSHYDIYNEKPVLCTMADWRIGSGKMGADKSQLYTSETIRDYRDMAPDCMGAWLIYWRQNMPGLNNRQKADGGVPMKNWWPFLFY